MAPIGAKRCAPIGANSRFAMVRLPLSSSLLLVPFKFRTSLCASQILNLNTLAIIFIKMNEILFLLTSIRSSRCCRYALYSSSSTSLISKVLKSQRPPLCRHCCCCCCCGCYIPGGRKRLSEAAAWPVVPLVADWTGCTWRAFLEASRSRHLRPPPRSSQRRTRDRRPSPCQVQTKHARLPNICVDRPVFCTLRASPQVADQFERLGNRKRLVILHAPCHHAHSRALWFLRQSSHT